MKVFISHAAEDRETAALLAAQLQREGLNVWTFNQIEPGENWAQRLGKEIAAADLIVFLMTGASIRSDFVRHEIEFALTQEHYKDRVITAILDDASQQQVPWILRTLPRVHADATESGIERVTQAVVSLARKACHAD
ncbi:MAG: toll/interleukin-1 receptor domain-containing protein [Planctomycetaceae bacterium]